MKTIEFNGIQITFNESKPNKAKIRRDVVEQLTNRFIESGKEFSCLASVLGFCKKDSLGISKLLLENNINLSKSNYPIMYVSLMADMFTMDAAKAVYNNFYKD